MLQHHYPNIPNVGDIKAIDWTSWTDIDAICGGYPCQPFSSAGHRRGTEDPRHLWPFVLEGIKAVRPAHVFLENVRGHLSLGFNIVLADLAAAGYEVRWTVLAASSVGAPHRRERLYIYAYPATDSYTVALPDKLDPAGHISHEGYVKGERVDNVAVSPSCDLFPTPRAQDSSGSRKVLPKGFTALKDLPLLLPTPNTMDSMPPRYGEACERQLHRGQGPESSRRSTMGNLREDIFLTLDPHRFLTPEKRDAALLADRSDDDWSPFNTAGWGAMHRP